MYSLPALICTLTIIGLSIVDARPKYGGYYGLEVDTTNPVNVLKAEMDDMQSGSTLLTYQLASPATRRATAGGGYGRGYDYWQFDRMVRSPIYMPLLDGYGYKVLASGPIGTSRYYADVKVERARGGSTKYRVILSKQVGDIVDTDISLGLYKMMKGHVPVWRTSSVLMLY